MAADRARERAPLLIAAAVVVAIAVAATIDFRATAGDLPPAPPPCEVPSEFCEDERTDAFDERFDQLIDAEEDFRSRAWVYGLGAFAVVLAATGFALARAGRAHHRRVFTDLGMGSVAWLAGGVGMLGIGSGEFVDVPTQPILYPGFALAAIAAIGTAVSPRSPEALPSGTAFTVGSRATIVGWVFTAVALVAAVLVLAGRGDPCTSDVPEWVDAVAIVGLAAAAVAALAGLLGLFARRWLSALILLGTGPIAAFVAALSTGCWN